MAPSLNIPCCALLLAGLAAADHLNGLRLNREAKLLGCVQHILVLLIGGKLNGDAAVFTDHEAVAMVVIWVGTADEGIE